MALKSNKLRGLTSAILYADEIVQPTIELHPGIPVSNLEMWRLKQCLDASPSQLRTLPKGHYQLPDESIFEVVHLEYSSIFTITVGGVTHCDDAPAYVSCSSLSGSCSKTYYANGRIHRDGLPAIVIYNENGTTEMTTYMVHGKRHRWGLPAVVRSFSCDNEYYVLGKHLPQTYIDEFTVRNGIESFEEVKDDEALQAILMLEI